MGDEFFLEETTEPTNVIWENRHWTPADYLKRGLVVTLAIVGLLAISFGAIFACKTFAIGMESKYPVVDCVGLNKLYGNVDTTLAKYAYWEYVG